MSAVRLSLVIASKQAMEESGNAALVLCVLIAGDVAGTASRAGHEIRSDIDGLSRNPCIYKISRDSFGAVVVVKHCDHCLASVFLHDASSSCAHTSRKP